MSLENQGGYHEVHVYERRKEDRRYTKLVQSHIVHGDRTQIAKHFWDILPDNQTPYVHEKIASTALAADFREKVTRVVSADGSDVKPGIRDIIFLGKN